MEIFLIILMIFLCVCSSFVGRLISFKLSEKSKNIIAVVTAIIVLGLIMASAFLIDYTANAKKWNNGYCSECGLQLRFAAARRDRRSISNFLYFWLCDNCGNVVITTKQFDIIK